MNENLANEIRKTIESVKDMKIQVGGINNYLSILEGVIRADYQKQIDDAYQRGYDKGYADKTNNIKAGKELAKDIYQRGLDDAWEAARKIVLSPDEGGTSLPDLFAIFGDGSMQRVFRSYSASEAIEKLKAYEEKQKANDEIKVGDEVKRKLASENDSRGIVTKEWGDIYYIMWPDGSSGKWYKDSIVKTGRHFDIKGFLEDVKK